MTFYEAALRVLEEAKRPLTHNEITKLSLEKGLLSHIGKTPEITMLSRLAAMAKRPRDRKVMVTAKDTFALADWMLPEDAQALETTGVAEPNPEDAMPQYRPIERHPEPRGDYVRAIGRQAERERKRRDDDTRKKRYPPVSEVAFEILTESGSGLLPGDLLKRAREKELASDELSIEQLLHALLDDNQKRIDGGRRPQFSYAGIEGAEAQLRLDAGSEIAPMDVQLQFAATAGVPVENGRPVLRAPQTHQPTPVSADDLAVLQAARQAGKDARRAMARVLRKKLSELDGGAFEKSVVRMMHKLSFREVKVAKRSKDGPLLTARRREGSLELRYAVRLLKGNASVERRQVQDLRRDLGHYAAHVGLLVGAGDPRGDAKSEALAGGAMVFLWCGEGLAEQFFEAQTGVKVTTVELYELDDAFFETAQKDAEEARARREERHAQRDRDEREGSPRPSHSGSDEAAAGSEGEGPVADEPRPPAPSHPQQAAAAEGDEGDDDSDDGEEGDEGGGAAGAAGGQPGQPGAEGSGGRRRRRRRRGRRGRGPRPEGAPGAPGAPAPAEGGGGEPSAPPPPAPPPPPSGGGEPGPS
ncbi:MAG: restriction endonuclease [Archangiaceae bacterium]|nr:restriction endonuclease [Archangiaceae bacterium]